MCLFAGNFVASSVERFLLAMQKVVGSNPISRFLECPAIAGFPVPSDFRARPFFARILNQSSNVAPGQDGENTWRETDRRASDAAAR